MVVLRATTKLRSAWSVSDEARLSDGALGDWYLNRLVVGRRPLLLVSAASLLSIVVRAKRVRDLPIHLPDLVAVRLVRWASRRH